jgi:hypothetical protein
VKYGFETTPYKPFSACPPIQTPDVIKPTKQEDLKNLIKKELFEVTFESKTIMEQIFGPVDDGLVEKVLEVLVNGGICPENGEIHYADASGVLCAFPKSSRVDVFTPLGPRSSMPSFTPQKLFFRNPFLFI